MRVLVSLFWLITTPIYALSPFATEATGQGIVFAQYSDALDIYPHRIMGSIREKDTLRVSDGTHQVSLRLSKSNPDHVFEDIRPTIGDVDGDGLNDVVVIETSLRLGASLAVYSLKGGALQKIVQTPYIGQRNRWYAVVGIGDFNGDGQNEVAFVDRPHLARVLRVFGFQDGQFQQIAAAHGLTNHAIGDEIIWGGVRRCDGRDEMVVQQVSSGRILALTVSSDSQLIGKDTGHQSNPKGFTAAMTCR